VNYLAFIARGYNPPVVLGVMEVPACFAPNIRLIDAANDLGMGLTVMEGSFSGALIDKGADIWLDVTAHADYLSGRV
jgi:hypothetical protein